MIRVLLVEEKNGTTGSLAPLLQASEMETVRCATAEQVLDAPPCDVVLADVDGPGVAVLRRLKERAPALPVLLLTGRGTLADALATMRAGALDFMTKPVEPEVIVERLRDAVERGRAEPRPSDLNLRRRLFAFERQLFREALSRARGKKSDAARMLGIDPSNWAYHAKRLQLQ